MSVSGREAPTTPPAAARSMSWTVGRSIRSNRVRILVASTATVVGVTVPPAAGPAAFTDPGRIVTTIVRSEPISTAVETQAHRVGRERKIEGPRDRGREIVSLGRMGNEQESGLRGLE